MADIPSGVGYLTVTASVFAAIADSNDVGEQPDALALNGSVIFEAKGLLASRPFVVAATTKKMLVLPKITCGLVNGVLYAPADGNTPANGETPAQPVRLVAPNQMELDVRNWYWSARFTPSVPSAWPTYTVNFTGEPGDAVDIADASLLEAIETNAYMQPMAWGVDGTSPVPAQARIGDWLVDTSVDPWFAYEIGL